MSKETDNGRHEVRVEVTASMNDRGEISIPAQTIKVPLETLNVKEWADDDSPYMVADSVTTTCGVVRDIISRRQ